MNAPSRAFTLVRVGLFKLLLFPTRTALSHRRGSASGVMVGYIEDINYVPYPMIYIAIGAIRPAFENWPIFSADHDNASA
jgi:hypothetical protein